MDNERCRSGKVLLSYRVLKLCQMVILEYLYWALTHIPSLVNASAETFGIFTCFVDFGMFSIVLTLTMAGTGFP